MRGSAFKLLGLCALLGGLAGGWILMDMKQYLERPLNLEGEARTYVIRPGVSLRAVAEDLQALGILDRPRYLLWYARWRREARRIQAGEYRIPAPITPAGLLQLFVGGKVIQRAFTLVEGWTFDELVAALRRDQRLVHTIDGLGAEEIMRRAGAPGTHPEGWFFPDTYYFTRGTRDIDLLIRARRAMQDYLREQWAGRAENLPYEAAYEALILASIIEKETADRQERARIAGVFSRRLERGMRLEADPTVIYGLGRAFDGDLRRHHLHQKSPYNTYTFKGLPPTPIAMPGAGAIRAALHPAPGDVLYFVARGDGTHAFSTTYEEHLRAVQKYRIRKTDRAALPGG